MIHCVTCNCLKIKLRFHLTLKFERCDELIIVIELSYEPLLISYKCRDLDQKRPHHSIPFTLMRVGIDPQQHMLVVGGDKMDRGVSLDDWLIACHRTQVTWLLVHNINHNYLRATILKLEEYC